MVCNEVSQRGEEQRLDFEAWMVLDNRPMELDENRQRNRSRMPKIPCESIPLRGLSSRDAERGLLQYGANDPTPAKRGAAVVELLVLFFNPLVCVAVVIEVTKSRPLPAQSV